MFFILLSHSLLRPAFPLSNLFFVCNPCHFGHTARLSLPSRAHPPTDFVYRTHPHTLTLLCCGLVERDPLTPPSTSSSSSSFTTFWIDPFAILYAHTGDLSLSVHLQVHMHLYHPGLVRLPPRFPTRSIPPPPAGPSFSPVSIGGSAASASIAATSYWAAVLQTETRLLDALQQALREAEEDHCLPSAEPEKKGSLPTDLRARLTGLLRSHWAALQCSAQAAGIAELPGTAAPSSSSSSEETTTPHAAAEPFVRLSRGVERLGWLVQQLEALERMGSDVEARRQALEEALVLRGPPPAPTLVPPTVADPVERVRQHLVQEFLLHQVEGKGERVPSHFFVALPLGPRPGVVQLPAASPGQEERGRGREPQGHSHTHIPPISTTAPSFSSFSYPSHFMCGAIRYALLQLHAIAAQRSQQLDHILELDIACVREGRSAAASRHNPLLSLHLSLQLSAVYSALQSLREVLTPMQRQLRAHWDQLAAALQARAVQRRAICEWMQRNATAGGVETSIPPPPSHSPQAAPSLSPAVCFGRSGVEVGFYPAVPSVALRRLLRALETGDRRTIVAASLLQLPAPTSPEAARHSRLEAQRPPPLQLPHTPVGSTPSAPSDEPHAPLRLLRLLSSGATARRAVAGVARMKVRRQRHSAGRSATPLTGGSPLRKGRAGALRCAGGGGVGIPRERERAPPPEEEEAEKEKEKEHDASEERPEGWRCRTEEARADSTSSPCASAATSEEAVEDMAGCGAAEAMTSPIQLPDKDDGDDEDEEEEEEEEGPQEFSLRAGFPLLKTLRAFTSAVVARAITFSDDDDEETEKTDALTTFSLLCGITLFFFKVIPWAFPHLIDAQHPPCGETSPSPSLPYYYHSSKETLSSMAIVFPHSIISVLD
eukprot:gene12177-8378_t